MFKKNEILLIFFFIRILIAYDPAEKHFSLNKQNIQSSSILIIFDYFLFISKLI